MLLHDSVVGSQDEGFRVGNQDVDPFEDVEVRLPLPGVDDFRSVLVAEFLHRAEHRQPIGLDPLRLGHALSDRGFDLETVNVFKHFHLGKSDGLILDGGHDQDGHLARPTAALVAALVHPALEEGVIDLDESGELVFCVAGLHGLSDLVEHSPGALEADVDLSGQGQSRESALVRRDQVDGPEPFHERCPRPMHDDPCREGCLMLAGGALVQQAFLQEIGLVTAAARATETIGPAEREEALATCFFGPEAALESDEVHFGVGLCQGVPPLVSKFPLEFATFAE